MRLMFARNILPNFESYTVKSYTFIVEDFFFYLKVVYNQFSLRIISKLFWLGAIT